MTKSEMRTNLKGLLSQKRDYSEEIKNIANNCEYVVFYGCGMILPSIVDTWTKYIGRRIDYCCDSDCEKWGKFFKKE